MLERVKEKPRYISPEFAIELEEMKKKTRKLVAEIKESVAGQKEEFNISEYYRIKYGTEAKPEQIREDVARSIEENYYLRHPEINNIADLVEYHELHEND